MLPKNSRLNLKKDFKRVVSGKVVETKYLKMFIKHSDLEETKIGIAISSKNFKKAHERNKAKRLASKAFEELYSVIPKGLQIVALPKSRILEVKSYEVVKDLNEAFNN